MEEEQEQEKEQEQEQEQQQQQQQEQARAQQQEQEQHAKSRRRTASMCGTERLEPQGVVGAGDANEPAVLHTVVNQIDQCLRRRGAGGK